MSMENHVAKKISSKRQERDHQSRWISGFFRRKKRTSSQEVDDNEHKIHEDSRLMRRHNNKAKNLHFSLSEIMRKLKHAISKEKPRHDQRLLEKKKSLQKSLSTKDHFFLERMASISRKRCHQEHYDYDKHLSDMLRNQRLFVSLPGYSSPFSSPGRIWYQNSTVLSRSSSSDDFIKSQTNAGTLYFLPFEKYYDFTIYPMIPCDSAADDSLTIKERDSAASSIKGSSSSPFISKSNQIVDEMSKVEAHDEEKGCDILEEASSFLILCKSFDMKKITEKKYKLIWLLLFLLTDTVSSLCGLTISAAIH